MKDTTVMQTFKELFWYSIANFIIKDAKNAILNDETFLRDVKNGRNATIHFSKKHLGVVASKVVDDLLDQQQYRVTSMKYRFHGMDVFVSQK